MKLARKQFVAIAALPEQPTAIFYHNDAMAIGAIQEAKKLGLRVPKDLSIVGDDDIIRSIPDPPLATVLNLVTKSDAKRC